MDLMTQITVAAAISIVSFFLGRYSARNMKKEEITIQRTASLIILSIWVVMQIVSFIDGSFTVANVFSAMALGAGSNILGLDLEKYIPWKK